MDVTIRPESTDDCDAIRWVNQSAFGGDDESVLVDRLRDGGFVEVSLVAVDRAEVVGHILFSRVTIITNDRPVAAVSLAPMAVLPSYQRQGIGSGLVTAGMERCRERGHSIAVVLGHPQFYPRFGFSTDFARWLDAPFGSGEAWMAAELTPGALADVAGQVEYPPPFGAFA